MRASKFSVFGALAGLSLLAACSSTKMTLEINSTPETNNGRPFYAIVRSVEQGTYVAETYEAVAAKVFATTPDPSVLRADVIYPGKKAEVTVQKPDALPLEIYFLFTTPGERWKILRPQPLPSSLSVELNGNDILTTQ